MKGLAAAWTAPGAEKREILMRMSESKVNIGPQTLRGLARLTSRSEEGGRVGKLLPRGQGPIGPRKAG